MSSCVETEHLLPASPSQQGINYGVFDFQENNPADFNAVSTGEGQHETELGQNNISQAPNDPENQGRSQQRRLSSFLSSYRPLKYSAIAFGLWSELGGCSLALRIAIPILLLPADYFLINLKFKCSFPGSWSNTNASDLPPWTGGMGADFDNWMKIFVQVPSYLIMIYCIRHFSKEPHVLRLPQAFKLANKTKSVNIILLVSISMLVTSMLMRKFCPLLIPSNAYVYRSSIYDDKSYLVWQLFFSVVVWQPVISCLVFGVVMKGLAALGDQCLERIIAMEADSVDHYIQVHQEFCFKVESTFAAFKKWFLVNTFAYIVLIFWVVIRVFSLLGNQYDEDMKSDLCYSPRSGQLAKLVRDTYYFLTYFLYASFICYYPWYSMAYLKRSLDHLVQKLNDKTDWSPQHLFKNRFHLNNFLQYAKNIEYRPFMRFTCREKIPYISVLLASCGLLFALYSHFKEEQKA